jgi:hypothetical protein
VKFVWNIVLSVIFLILFSFYYVYGGEELKIACYVSYVVYLCESSWWFNTSVYLLMENKIKCLKTLEDYHDLRPMINLESLKDQDIPEVCEFGYSRWADLSSSLKSFNNLRPKDIAIVNVYLISEVSPKVQGKILNLQSEFNEYIASKVQELMNEREEKEN